LRRRLFHRPCALAVSVNSVGGSVVGAKNIARHISQFASENEVPLYTFADDVCLGAANIILAAGWKSYASTTY
jgi:ClpP class serine protease